MPNAKRPFPNIAFPRLELLKVYSQGMPRVTADDPGLPNRLPLEDPPKSSLWNLLSRRP